MTVRGSTNVKLLNGRVYYLEGDGINIDDDSRIFASSFNIQHTTNDCFSAHSDIHDQDLVGRKIQIVGGPRFDTHSIDIASAVGLSITGTVIDSFKVAAITLAGTPPGNGANEGNAEGQDVLIDGVTMSNGFSTARRLVNGQPDTTDPARIDLHDPTAAYLDYIIVGALSARAGSGTYVPGEKGVSPYPFWANNSNTASVPIAEWRNISIVNATFSRRFGATDETGTSTPQAPIFTN